MIPGHFVSGGYRAWSLGSHAEGETVTTGFAGADLKVELNQG